MREWFKLVDALEEVTDLWNWGSNMTAIPTYNTYVPTRSNIIKKPILSDDSTDNKAGY